MKKELLISTLILIVLMGGTFLLIRNRVITSPSPLPKPSTVEAEATVTTAPSAVVSLLTIQTHNASDDCWIIVNNKAYDVSSYIAAHPGGAETIIPFCGKESTQAFDTIKDGRGHSLQASMDLDLYFVADVE